MRGRFPQSLAGIVSPIAAASEGGCGDERRDGSRPDTLCRVTIAPFCVQHPSSDSSQMTAVEAGRQDTCAKVHSSGGLSGRHLTKPTA